MKCRLGQVEKVTGKPDQDATGNEILRISGGRGGAGRLFLRQRRWMKNSGRGGRRRGGWAGAGAEGGGDPEGRL